MKEHLSALVQNAASPPAKINLAREYLQSLILQSLQRSGAMIALAFHGGTALRFLYSLPRYSEGLDFTLENDRAEYNFRVYLQAIQKDLLAQGYDVTLKVNDGKTVHSAFIRFSKILNELALSPHREETLSVKIEVDTHPPAGGALGTSLIRRHVLLHLHHHDKATLLAGKLHAILQRPYTKGRDLYDLMWYLSDRNWPPPNLNLLNNALEQTGWTGAVLTPESWRDVVRAKIEAIPFGEALDDVRPFLESQNDLTLLTRENLLRLAMRE